MLQRCSVGVIIQLLFRITLGSRLINHQAEAPLATVEREALQPPSFGLVNHPSEAPFVEVNDEIIQRKKSVRLVNHPETALFTVVQEESIEPSSLKLNAHQSEAPYIAVHDETFQPTHILRVTVADIPIDCTTRRSVVINGTVPGPELRFKAGQKVWVRVYNDMDDYNLTIHWHGLSQRMAPFADGTTMVSQWPIPPHYFFDYEFQLRTDDAGTYFYHSHVGFQAVTASGALIIDHSDGEKPPYEYDEERTIVLQDVYYATDEEVIAQLTSDHFVWPGDPNNILVNGKSRANASLYQTGPNCEMAVIEVDPNRTYRLRFIGDMAYSTIYLAFEDHFNLVLIEVDGRYVAAQTVHHLEVSSGQRYSVLLRSKTLEELNGNNRYWMQMETRSPDNNTLIFGILHYNVGYGPVDTFSLPATKPLTLPNETFAEGWLEETLEKLTQDPNNLLPKLEEITRRIYVNVQEVVTPTNTTLAIHFEQAGSPWFEHTPKEPYLVSLYKNTTRYFPDYERALQNGGFDNVTKTFPVKIGEVIEIVWQNLGNLAGTVMTHPWHAHGGHYWDVGTGAGTYDPVANEARLLARQGRIISRDTSNIYRPAVAADQKLGPGAVYSWRVMRMRVQNPGVWIIHCHALQHMIMGMQTVWVFGEPKDLMPLPKNLIEDGYLVYGGAAYGNDSYSPRVLHYWNEV